MTTTTITAVMKNGERLTGLSLRELFPTFNTEFARNNDYIEIVGENFTIRVSSCFLLATESGKWYADVLSSDGSKFRNWNGTIYNGGVVYMDNKKFTLNADVLARFNAIIALRNEMIQSLRSR